MAQLITMSLPQSAAEVSRPKSEIAPPVAELTRGMLEGEEEAYQNFFTRYARRLLLYNLALCNGQEDTAKELLQLTMIRVARYIKVFAEEEALWNWLRNVARSCWIDEHRKKNRYWSFLNVFRQEQNDISGQEGEVEARFADAFAQLDSEEKQLLEEKYLEGLSVKELAELRCCTEKAVESKLSRLRQKLKELVAR